MFFEPHSFDFFITVEVIEHVHDPRGLPRQVRASSAPKSAFC